MLHRFHRERTNSEVRDFRYKWNTETAFQIKKLTIRTCRIHNYINNLPLNFKALAYLTIFEHL